MTRHEATFEIDSKTDSLAVQRILERVHDTIREGSRSVGEDTANSSERIRAFEALRESPQACTRAHDS